MGKEGLPQTQPHFQPSPVAVPKATKACDERPLRQLVGMSKGEILQALPGLTPAEREEISRRLAELDETGADQAALARAEELATGKVQPKSQAEIFQNARATLG